MTRAHGISSQLSSPATILPAPHHHHLKQIAGRISGRTGQTNTIGAAASLLYQHPHFEKWRRRSCSRRCAYLRQSPPIPWQSRAHANALPFHAPHRHDAMRRILVADRTRDRREGPTGLSRAMSTEHVPKSERDNSNYGSEKKQHRPSHLQMRRSKRRPRQNTTSC